jgi:hypothetical protein
LSRIPLILFAVSACAQESPATLDRLPVKRVVLYKNGVGYFEHLGPVHDKQDVTISFTSGQLNDVLKSLTVLDLSGGRIAGVAYGSAAPIDRQLGDLHLPVGEKSSLTEFLGALRGARLEVRSGTTTITGRLLSIERKTRIAGGTTLEVDYLSLITDSGDVRTTELTPAFSVRLLEKGLPQKVDRFLDLIASGRDADVRRMVISTEGSGERSLFVSYISEVPVWKATYRIVLNTKRGEGPLLQGWAIVDNTVGQDWDNVQLSLVAGAPQSFVENLSQPYYSRRPVVSMPQSMMVSPQTYESTLISGVRLNGTVADASGAVVPGAVVRAYDASGSLAGETTSNAAGLYEFAALPDGPVNLEVQRPGFQTARINNVMVSNSKTAQTDVRLQVGNASQAVEVNARNAESLNASKAEVSAAGPNAGTNRALGSGAGLGARAFTPPRAAPGSGGGFGGGVYRTGGGVEVAARAQELGDLFEYKLKDPITIPKNRSALLPIVQSSIGAEKVSVWNERAGLPRPQRALWLTNTSGLTLDGGSFSVLEEETFAGEGIFDSIRPAEKRLVSYATDLALNVSSKNSNQQERVTRVRVLRGVMTQEREVREKKTYTFRNEDTSPRVAIVEHPVRAGYELRSEVKPSETTVDWMRFRLPVASKETAVLVVEEARPIQSSYQLTNVTSDQIDLFVRQKSIDKTIEDALRKILAQKAVVSDLNDRKSALEDETSKIYDDQQRLRENMKALKGSAEEKVLLQRYTRQLNDQEDRLEALGKESKQLESQRESAQALLDKMIQDLSFDVKM